MVLQRRHLVLTGLLLLTFSSNEVTSQCSKQDYQHCVKLADPLLKDPHLIYPDNPRDIENVCRTWTFFVECVKSYTDRCFTEARRQEFNKAVESPVSSIHRLCSMPEYREEFVVDLIAEPILEPIILWPFPNPWNEFYSWDYLKHASCMKMILTQDAHCGRHYRLLVSQVSGEAPTASVCCSHHMLRECVVDQAKTTCDPNSAPYSATMLDKALSFLRDQCSNFIPNQLDCPGADFYQNTSPSRAETDRRLNDQEHVVVNTRPTFVEVETTRATSGTSSSHRLPSSHLTPSSRPPSTMASSPSLPTTTTLDSRGSGSSFHPSMPSSTRSEPDPWSPTVTSAQEESERTSFARGMTWRTVGGAPPTSPGTWKVSSSDIWLPSSRLPPLGNAIDVDEPNQQGLGSSGKLDNSGIRPCPAPPILTITALLLPTMAFLLR